MIKKSFKTLSCALLALLVTFTSCKKDEPEEAVTTVPAVTPEPTPTPPTAGSPTPAQFGNATSNSDGALIAIKTASTTSAAGQSFETVIGTGVAYFTNTAGNFSTFVDAGAVSLEGTALEIQENKSYVHVPGATIPTGISFSGGADWTVAGAGSISAFNATFSRFPATPDITSTAAIKKNSVYTVTYDAASSNTVFVSIYSGLVSITKGIKAKSGSNSVEFTAAETKDMTVGDGAALVQVALANFKTDSLGSKNYVLINETVVTELMKVE